MADRTHYDDESDPRRLAKTSEHYEGQSEQAWQR